MAEKRGFLNRPDDDDDRGDRMMAAIWRAISELQERSMATQVDLDALTTEIEQVATDLAAASAAIQAELTALAAANPGLNLAALQAAVAPLDAAVQAVGALKPAATPPAV